MYGYILFAVIVAISGVFILHYMGYTWLASIIGSGFVTAITSFFCYLLVAD